MTMKLENNLEIQGHIVMTRTRQRYLERILAM